MSAMEVSLMLTLVKWFMGTLMRGTIQYCTYNHLVIRYIVPIHYL